ncbi:MOSC domain-containing protein [Paenibacillus pinisoli]|uniref:MOSC domain-containing protein n=1 Tax=Paenibacillus pinisoli TaxID=1276110 RepID=A0A3A6PAA0_9BACL|nr:MOSC N-terminal beta barrel domain-containing protein [Paenibacillus pinisoli]RJX37187.1 MOSC domain-containing protein [Paenibacillus pinisoli]
MAKRIGEVSAIYRYPVKSFRGERLEGCEVAEYGLRGDRVCSFYDETKEGWSRFVTARAIPDMLSYQASYASEEVRIIGPDGSQYNWDDRLLEQIQSRSRKTLSMSAMFAPNPESDELLSVDAASLLILTDKTIREIEAKWGKELDELRFRPNLMVKLEEDEEEEQSWIGKRLRIGDAELRVDSACERCSMITIDPATLERDPSLLKQVNEHFQLNVGVYASVTKTGFIRMGDSLSLLD